MNCSSAKINQLSFKLTNKTIIIIIIINLFIPY